MGEMICRLQKEALDIIREKSGIKLKINIVVVPGVNTDEIEDIIEATKDYDVHIYNLIPMLPVSGTKFGSIRQMTDEEMSALRARVRERFPDIYIKENCNRCRADACGKIK